MTPALYGQMTTVLILAAIALYLGYRAIRTKRVQLRLRRSIKAFQAMRYQQAHEEALEIDRVFDRVHRQRKLLKIADYVADAPTEERLRMMRTAESLGFMDDESGPWVA